MTPDIEILETFVFYDGPKLFTASDKDTGQQFLALFVEETDTTETTLFAPLTPVRCALLASGALTLVDAVTAPDGPVLQRVQWWQGSLMLERWSDAPVPLPAAWTPVPGATVTG